MKKRPRRVGPGKTIPRLAEAYRKYISEATLRRAAARGDLKTVRFGGSIVVTPMEERRFCELLEIPVQDA